MVEKRPEEMTPEEQFADRCTWKEGELEFIGNDDSPLEEIVEETEEGDVTRGNVRRKRILHLHIR